MADGHEQAMRGLGLRAQSSHNHVRVQNDAVALPWRREGWSELTPALQASNRGGSRGRNCRGNPVPLLLLRPLLT
jgi:hypothetical protein